MHYYRLKQELEKIRQNSRLYYWRKGYSKRHRKGPSIVLKIKCPFCGHLISYEKFITRDVNKAEIRAFKFAGYKQIIPVEVDAGSEVMAFIEEVVKTKLEILKSMYADMGVGLDVSTPVSVNSDLPTILEVSANMGFDIPVEVMRKNG